MPRHLPHGKSFRCSHTVASKGVCHSFLLKVKIWGHHMPRFPCSMPLHLAFNQKPDSLDVASYKVTCRGIWLAAKIPRNACPSIEVFMPWHMCHGQWACHNILGCMPQHLSCFCLLRILSFLSHFYLVAYLYFPENCKMRENIIKKIEKFCTTQNKIK